MMSINGIKPLIAKNLHSIYLTECNEMIKYLLVLLLFILAEQSIASYPVIYQKTTHFLNNTRALLGATSVGNLAIFAGGYGLTVEDQNGSDDVSIFNTETRLWSTAKLSQPRFIPLAISIGQLALFAFGTVENSTYHTVDIFDTSNGKWSSHALCTEVDIISKVASVSKYVLYWGLANNQSVVCRFDPTTIQWTIDKIDPRVALVMTAATNAGKYALFAGGIDITSLSTSNLVFIFDSETLQWSTATLSHARADLAATSTGERAFFGGGTDEPIAYDTVDIFDSKTKTWSVNWLSRPRSDLAATSVGPYVIFAGGVSSDGPTALTDVDIFDTNTNLWTYATLATGQAQGSATSAGRFAFFAGGMNDKLRANTIDIFEFPEASGPVSSNVPVTAPLTSATSSLHWLVMVEPFVALMTVTLMTL